MLLYTRYVSISVFGSLHPSRWMCVGVCMYGCVYVYVRVRAYFTLSPIYNYVLQKPLNAGASNSACEARSTTFEDLTYAFRIRTPLALGKKGSR